MKKESVEKLLKQHFEQQKESFDRKKGFNELLMDKIRKAPIPTVPWLTNTFFKSWVMALCFLLVLSTGYSVLQNNLLDWQQLGIEEIKIQGVSSGKLRYTLYAFGFLLFYSLLDRLIQIKKKTNI